MKKRLTSVLMVAAMAAMMVTGCGSSDSKDNTSDSNSGAGTEAKADAGESADSSEDLLEKIKSAGKITIAMEGNWAPWTYEDEEGNLVGFEVEVSGAVAEKLGVTPEYVTGEWDGLLAGVQAGRYDLMANGVGYSDERAEAYNFSDFYAFNRTALVVRGDNEEITSLDDLEGKTTCNSANSTYQIIAENHGATVKDVESLDGTIEELLSGRVDATLNAEVSIADYMKEKPDADIKIVAFDDEVEKVGMIMPHGDGSKTLQEAINKALDELRADGTLSEISNKYFGIDITSEN